MCMSWILGFFMFNNKKLFDKFLSNINFRKIFYNNSTGKEIIKYLLFIKSSCFNLCSKTF